MSRSTREGFDHVLSHLRQQESQIAKQQIVTHYITGLAPQDRCEDICKIIESRDYILDSTSTIAVSALAKAATLSVEDLAFLCNRLYKDDDLARNRLIRGCHVKGSDNGILNDENMIDFNRYYQQFVSARSDGAAAEVYFAPLPTLESPRTSPQLREAQAVAQRLLGPKDNSEKRTEFF